MAVIVLFIIIMVLCAGSGGSSSSGTHKEYCCPYCGQCYDDEGDYLDCIARDEYDIDEGIW